MSDQPTRAQVQANIDYLKSGDGIYDITALTHCCLQTSRAYLALLDEYERLSQWITDWYCKYNKRKRWASNGHKGAAMSDRPTREQVCKSCGRLVKEHDIVQLKTCATQLAQDRMSDRIEAIYQAHRADLERKVSR